MKSTSYYSFPLLLLIFISINVRAGNDFSIPEDSSKELSISNKQNIQSTPDVPPLLPETLSNGGKEYKGLAKVTFVLKTPENTPANSAIYLSGTFDEWSGGGNDKYKFNKTSANTYELSIKEDAGSVLQFKVTRGSWDSGEVDERGRRIGNRVLYIRNKPLHIQLVVNKWNDKSDERENTDAGYWNTSIPDYQDNSVRPKIKLNGIQAVIISSLDDYQDQGATALNFEGEDISSKIITNGLPVNDNSGDYIITYSLTDSKGREASPISRLLRVLGNTPVSYSLRPVGTTGSHLGYIEQLPTNYGKKPKKLYPLFIYHHGAGGEASSMDLTRRTSLFELSNWWGGGTARIAMRGNWNTDSSLIVLSPQRSYFETDVQRIDAFVDYAIKNYQVDPKRIYMGGFSAGGYVSWEYAINYPDKVAAIIPMSGGVLPKSASNICNAKNVSVWAFHSTVDKSVDVMEAENAIRTYNNCQPIKKAKLTLFDNVGHASHQQVLELEGMFNYLDAGDPFDENIYTWMMKQNNY
jgi:predicted esterase